MQSIATIAREKKHHRLYCWFQRAQGHGCDEIAGDGIGNHRRHHDVSDVIGRGFFDSERVGIYPTAHFRLPFKSRWVDSGPGRSIDQGN